MPNDEGCVYRIERCELSAVNEPWAYASDNASPIEAHWLRRTRENPRLFNGRIFVLSGMRIEGPAMVARFLPTDFKSFLHWRLAA